MARRVLQDEYFRRAKAEGYVARSAYKLKQISERTGILRRGDRVLDLGCAPGSWLQVAREIAGPGGIVVGLDLQPVEHRIEGARTLVGDVSTIDPAALLDAADGRPFNVVLSDMAPSTSGAGDHFLSVRLCRSVIDLLPRVLVRGGATAMKVLEGAEYPALLADLRAIFDDVRGFKPHASRSVSSEIYAIGRGFRGA